MNMPVESFLTALYVMVDDWYQAEGSRLLAGKAGVKPTFSDSEVMTLALAQHWCGFDSEQEWLRYLAANYRPLFPQLVCQSQFNRRARSLCWLTNALRRFLLQQLGVRSQPVRLIDGTPILVRHWRRYSRTCLRLPGASLGHCAAKRETFYGYRLVLLVTLDGAITDWTLIPANADEREGALDLLFDYRNLTVLGDKGFLDQWRQACLLEERGVRLLTPKRANQKEQNPAAWDEQLNRARRLIETTIAQAKGSFGLEKPRARTLWGLGSRLIAKLTGLTVAAFTNLQQGRSPLLLADFSF